MIIRKRIQTCGSNLISRKYWLVCKILVWHAGVEIHLRFVIKFMKKILSRIDLLSAICFRTKHLIIFAISHIFGLIQ